MSYNIHITILLLTLPVHQHGTNYEPRAQIQQYQNLYFYLLFFHVVIFLFALYRISRRPTEDNPDSTFTPLPKNITPLGMELDPDTGVDLSNTDKK